MVSGYRLSPVVLPVLAYMHIRITGDSSLAVDLRRNGTVCVSSDGPASCPEVDSCDSPGGCWDRFQLYSHEPHSDQEGGVFCRKKWSHFLVISYLKLIKQFYIEFPDSHFWL